MTTEVENIESQQETVADDGRGDNKQNSAGSNAPVDPVKKRRRLFLSVGLLIVFLLGITTWWLIARNYEDTDDAQVDGHMNPIASRIAGTVQAVRVEDNQQVRAGEPLIELDPRDYDVALTQAKADLNQAEA